MDHQTWEYTRALEAAQRVLQLQERRLEKARLEEEKAQADGREMGERLSELKAAILDVIQKPQGLIEKLFGITKGERVLEILRMQEEKVKQHFLEVLTAEEALRRIDGLAKEHRKTLKFLENRLATEHKQFLNTQAEAERAAQALQKASGNH